jgi:eukaryotic-like serine/threonine-protein kinase
MIALPARFGPFVLESRLAVGGTSEAYLARMYQVGAEAFPTKFIVKRPLPQFQADAGWRAMFAREGRLQALISHPNVVRVFDAGTVSSGEPYLATEYVEGVDGERLARRARQEGALMAPGLATYIAREILLALDAVHSARDESGGTLGIVHRDVTPSNIYLSRKGEVKLGDFGLAHAQHRSSIRSETGQSLKGKFAYLAPEQVAGETFDHRADLFSAAVGLAELLLGHPLFEGGGQLAILLAIRDGHIDAIDVLESKVPKGLLSALRVGLARSPKSRFESALMFREALEPFCMRPEEAARALAEKVAWVLTHPSRAMPVAKPVQKPLPEAQTATSSHTPHTTLGTVSADEADEAPTRKRDHSITDDRSTFDKKTVAYATEPSYVRSTEGVIRGPLAFAALAEELATGAIGRGDQVSYAGAPYTSVEDIPGLERLLPAKTLATREVQIPKPPTEADTLNVQTILRILAQIVTSHATGVIFAERPVSPANPKAVRKELYFEDGQLQHVGSSNATELLGEYLVRRGEIAREELDLALVVLPRYGGRIGDTLIALGLVSGFNVFRAIRDQGRDRVADLFRWGEGTWMYYADEKRPRVEFPLRLEVTQLMLAGLEALPSAESSVASYLPRLEQQLRAGREPLTEFPPVLEYVRNQLRAPLALRELLANAATDAAASAQEILRSVEVLVALGALEWVPAPQ